MSGPDSWATTTASGFLGGLALSEPSLHPATHWTNIPGIAGSLCSLGAAVTCGGSHCALGSWSAAVKKIKREKTLPLVRAALQGGAQRLRLLWQHLLGESGGTVWLQPAGGTPGSFHSFFFILFRPPLCSQPLLTCQSQGSAPAPC